MNKNIKKLAVLFVAAATMITVSCKKEDNTNPENGGSTTFTTAKGEFNYKVNFDAASVDALSKGYDIFIDFYDADGTIKTSTEITDSQLTWEKSVTKTTFPTWFGLRVRMVPKSDLSGVEESEEFDLKGYFSVVGDITSTAGKHREISKKIDINKIGVEPHNGHSYKETLRYEVKTNGDSEVSTSWDD
jgi:hypothetical protein